MLDIAVAGGGPVGSRAAEKLADLGYEVAVFEKRPEIGQKPCCTGIVSQECVNQFRIPAKVISREVNSARIFSPSGDYIQVYRPETQACIINRQAFDNEMAKRARAKGVRFQLNTKVNNIYRKEDRVVVETEVNGETGQVEARAMVLATGFNDSLAKRAGFAQTAYFTAGAQAEVQGIGLNEVEVYLDQKLAPGFFGWLVPTAGDRCLAGLMSRKSPGYYLREWITQLVERGKISPGQYKIHYSGIPLKPLARTFGERMLAAGDAAGQVKPTTGGGIYFGMLCADIAADTLHKAFTAGDFSAKQMSLYEKRWKKKLGQELRKEYMARRFYERLSDKQIDRLFTRLKSSGFIEALLKEDELSFDWHGGIMLKAARLGAVHWLRALFSTGGRPD